jgi:hypothetical protein
MAYRRSSVKGATSFRRLVRQLPDASQAELLVLLNQAGPVIAARMKARTPVLATPRKDRQAGALRDGIAWKVNARSMTLQVGLLGTPRGRAKLFYGHIIDVGRKAKTVTIKRGAHEGSALHVRALTPLRLVYKGLQDFRSGFLPEYRQLMDRILLRAAQGAGDD